MQSKIRTAGHKQIRDGLSILIEDKDLIVAVAMMELAPIQGFADSWFQRLGAVSTDFQGMPLSCGCRTSDVLARAVLLTCRSKGASVMWSKIDIANARSQAVASRNGFTEFPAGRSGDLTMWVRNLSDPIDFGGCFEHDV